MLRTAFIILFAISLTACNQTNQGGHAGHEQPQQEAPTQENAHENHNQHKEHQSEQDSQVQAIWEFEKQLPNSQQSEPLTITIQDNTGKPIEDFKISHEKKMHLIVVSKDLSQYQHLHPEYIGGGVFKVETNFPTGGDYKLIADFVPEGLGEKTQTHWVTVKGDQPVTTPIEPETNLTKAVEGKEVTLSFDNLQAGQEVTLTWNFRDVNTNQPITNLEQYLGAVGHVVILSADTEEYLHTHPVEKKSTGPDAKFATDFPSSGLYKIWGEFKHQGKVFIVPFTVQVP